jgi:beta-glucosidase
VRDGRSPSFPVHGSGDVGALRPEAVEATRPAGTAVLLLGLAQRQESDGFDREHIGLPEDRGAFCRPALRCPPAAVAGGAR